jgi:chorismate mutase
MTAGSLQAGIYHNACEFIPQYAVLYGPALHSEDDGMELADWRKKIDELDEQIVQMISQRAQAAKAIGEIKKNANLPIYEPSREQTVFAHVKAVNPGPLADAELLHVYERIIDVMRSLQRHDS